MTAVYERTHTKTRHTHTFDDAPRINTSPESAPVDLENLTRAWHGKRDGGFQFLVLFLKGFILVRIALGKLINLKKNIPARSKFINYASHHHKRWRRTWISYCFSSWRTCALKRLSSVAVRESALAMTGTRLTFLWSFFIAATSSIRNLSSQDREKQVPRHTLTIQFEYLPTTVRRNEIKTTMNTIVDDWFTMESAFVLEIFLELDVYVIGKSLTRLFRV